MQLVLLHAVVQDMVVLSQLQSVICEKVNGEWLLLILIKKEFN
jgi:hypothetical protein